MQNFKLKRIFARIGMNKSTINIGIIIIIIISFLAQNQCRNNSVLVKMKLTVVTFL